MAQPSSKSRTGGPYNTSSVPGDYKKLIVCCDGTWQAANKSYGELTMPSNAVKMSRALSTAQVVNGKEVSQVVYYQSGVGTAELSGFARALYGNLGMGLDQNILGAYYFLTNNYDDGDEIYLFGFSRGAYTVRIVADLVAKFGLIQKDSIDRFPYLYEKFRDRVSEDEFEAQNRAEIDALHTLRSKIKVIGVWDTVGSMGFPQNWPWWVAKPLSWLVGFPMVERKFRDANLSDNIEHAFQALGLDEHRRPFSPALWHLPPTKTGDAGPELLQCWFPGVHINTGGGSALNRKFMITSQTAAARCAKATAAGSDKPLADYITFIDQKDTDLENLAGISFAWMVDLVRPYLAFDDYYLVEQTEAMNATLQMAPPPRVQPGIREYAAGPITDTYSSMFGWAMGGSAYRRPGQYNDRNHFEDPNFIAKDTNEYMHPCVRVRHKLLLKDWSKVMPQSLSGFGWEPNGVAGEHSSEWVYRKPLPNGEVVSIPEWKVASGGIGQSAERFYLGEDLAKEFGI